MHVHRLLLLSGYLCASPCGEGAGLSAGRFSFNVKEADVSL